jgi:predicted DNA-binding protein (MmcQ/YjbR family)
MDIESVRTLCLSLPHVTENVQWGNDLLFKIGGKIFAVVNLDQATPNRLSFKCEPEKYSELIDQENIIPAPYMARYNWVTLQRFDAIEEPELKNLLKKSYNMVFSKLSKSLKNQLDKK